MGKQPFVSHVVNGYSRYDVPESKAFSCTPGPLYPVRIDYINARDRVTIAQGIDVRSNPLAVPSFNPYVVRLHRFWVPLQLYHPEMRTNSSKFDMNDLSLNWIPNGFSSDSTSTDGTLLARDHSYQNSLSFWLRAALPLVTRRPGTDYTTVNLNGGLSVTGGWVNADTYLAYWDIVRNYYGYSQWGLYSFVWPASWRVVSDQYFKAYSFEYPLTQSALFNQAYGNLEFLDAYFESQFYPYSVDTTNNTYNRFNLFRQIIDSDLSVTPVAAQSNGYPVAKVESITLEDAPTDQFSLKANTTATTVNLTDIFYLAHPLAVVPSNPDRYSRLMPTGSSSAVSTSNVTTIPQLAIASRLQEYKDLLGAGGNRYSDWLETFFASKIEHVDRPKLLFSASQTVNVQVIMNQAGTNNFSSTGSLINALGQQGGSIAFNTQLGRSQSYYFAEPGYMIDMLSIRPVYYWASIQPDYLTYQGADYFNPIYNDIGYQDVPWRRLGLNTSSTAALALEPCFNEFRSSYDEVLGQINVNSGDTKVNGEALPLYSYWVQQRSVSWDQYDQQDRQSRYYPALFVDMSQVNSPFQSNVEDNFFVNLSYSIRKKNLVNKTFATRLSNR